MRSLADCTLDLVRIPSVTGHEAALADYVQVWAEGLGSDLTVVRLGQGVVVTGPLEAHRPTIGLFGHLDTVLPSPEQPTELRESHLYGCGASDMKAGLAWMMQAVEERARWACNLVAVFYDREEGPAAENGLDALLPLLPPLDLAVMHEPTANRLELGCVGGLHARLTVRGRRAHSARPWQGDNALFRALPLLQRLQGFARREVVLDGLSFYEVMTPTMAATFNSRNVVPDRLELNLNFRFAPGREVADAERELRELVGSDADLEIVDIAPSGAVCRQHPLVATWIEQAGLEVTSKQAWTDVARLTACGVAAVNYGPGDPAQAHQANEYVEVAALGEGYRGLATLLGNTAARLAPPYASQPPRLPEGWGSPA